MSIKNLSKKIKLAKMKKTRLAPRWADIRKFGMKRVRTRRINVMKKRWRSSKIKI